MNQPYSTLRAQMRPEAQEAAQAKAEAFSRTPSYYTTAQGDLYDVFITRFGANMVRQHLTMQAIEYLWRLDLKGQPQADAAKVAWLMKRIIPLLDQTPSTPAVLPQDPESAA